MGLLFSDDGLRVVVGPSVAPGLVKSSDLLHTHTYAHDRTRRRNKAINKRASAGNVFLPKALPLSAVTGTCVRLREMR